MISRHSSQNRRVGFWLGEASLAYGGIGPYAFRILDAILEERQPGWQFVLLCQENDYEDISRRFAHLANVAIETIPSSFSPSGRLDLIGWLSECKLDLLHFPTQTILRPELQTSYNVSMQEVRALAVDRLSIPYLITMHDVQELHFPEYFMPYQRAIRAVHYWKAIEKAKAVIVSFDHVRRDLLRFFDVPTEKIHVCPIPYKSISLPAPTTAARSFYQNKYQSWNPFLLYPAHVWPHKNHALLLRALRELKDTGFPSLKLVCTGGSNHPCIAQVLSQVAQLSLADSVIFSGVVPEDELRWLYQHAALVTIPTRYEAGSFPLYEAMMLGAPVICSKVTSLPDAIRSLEFTFDPEDVSDLVELITRMLSDESLRASSRSNGLKQFDRLRAVASGPFFYDAYRYALGAEAISSPGSR